MSAKEKRGEVLPFEQNATFYLNRGRKFLEKSDYARALPCFAQAYEKDPKSADIALTLAETLNHMQRFDESLRVILAMGNYGDMASDGLFGLASNYLALEEFEAAQSCLEHYLDADPDGPFSEEAADYLDLLEDKEALTEHLGLDGDEDVDLISHIHFAKSLHYNGRDDTALSYLLSLEKDYPDSRLLSIEIALAQFCQKRYKAAQQRLFGVLKKDKDNVRAICLLALLYRARGKSGEAREMMARARLRPDLTMEELSNIAVIHLELEDWDKAKPVLERLALAQPFGRTVTHHRAYLAAKTGDLAAARKLYQTLLELDKTDTVAAWYLSTLQGDNPEGCANWTIPFEVPLREALLRMRTLAEAHQLPLDELVHRWHTDPQLRYLAGWALTSSLSRVKPDVMCLLALVRGETAERLLRDFLLWPDQSDEDKQQAFCALQSMGAEGPYSVYYNGVWQYGVVRPITPPERLPVCYQVVYDYLADVQDEGLLGRRVMDVAIKIYQYFISTLADELPHLSQNQEVAMAAAFTLMASHTLQQDTEPEQICDIYSITMRRLNNALQKIFLLMEGEKEI
ncbi:MAG: tetratricopeptide repeat protein [Clostridiales bacterium]|nr:tetratricopeptide repeat protein [Clostridiales bacterium]